eukprot:1550672-Alexandrium_andersonii.AAC.1
MRSLELLVGGLPEVQRANLIYNFVEGIEVLTDYSGTGQAEYAMSRLAAWVQLHDAAPSVLFLRSSDIKESCRR